MILRVTKSICILMSSLQAVNVLRSKLCIPRLHFAGRILVGTPQPVDTAPFNPKKFSLLSEEAKLYPI